MTRCRSKPWPLLFAVAATAASLHCARPAAPEPARTPAEPVVAFVGVTLLPLDTAAAVPDQTVVVRGERIERVGPRGAVEVPPEAQVIAGRGRTLMPGLIDAHVHLARTEDLAILVALGVTTVRNMWGAPIHLEWRDRVARGELPGPTIYTAGPIVDGEHPAHPGSLIVRSEADADRAIALHRRLGYDLVKVYSRLTPPVFDRLAEGARRAGLSIAGHVPWSVALDHAVDAGMGSIEHMTGVIAVLQAGDSPVPGRSDGPWRDRDIDHVDGRYRGSSLLCLTSRDRPIPPNPLKHATLAPVYSNAARSRQLTFGTRQVSRRAGAAGAGAARARGAAARRGPRDRG